MLEKKFWRHFQSDPIDFRGVADDDDDAAVVDAVVVVDVGDVDVLIRDFPVFRRSLFFTKSGQKFFDAKLMNRKQTQLEEKTLWTQIYLSPQKTICSVWLKPASSVHK